MTARRPSARIAAPVLAALLLAVAPLALAAVAAPASATRDGGDAKAGPAVQRDGEGWVRMTVTDRDAFLERLVVRLRATPETARLGYRDVDGFDADVPAPPTRLDVRKMFHLTAYNGSRETTVDWARMRLAVREAEANTSRPAALAHLDGDWTLTRPDDVNRTADGAIYRFEVDGFSPVAFGYLRPPGQADWTGLSALLGLAAAGAIVGAAVASRGGDR